MALNGFLDFFQKGKVGSGLHLRSHNVYIQFLFYLLFLRFKFFEKYFIFSFNNQFIFDIVVDISTEKEIYSGNNTILAT